MTVWYTGVRVLIKDLEILDFFCNIYFILRDIYYTNVGNFLRDIIISFRFFVRFQQWIVFRPMKKWGGHEATQHASIYKYTQPHDRDIV